MRYAIVIEKTGSNFSGYVPDLPGCVATGTTVEDRVGSPGGHRISSHRTSRGRHTHSPGLQPRRLHRSYGITKPIHTDAIKRVVCLDHAYPVACQLAHRWSLHAHKWGARPVRRQISAGFGAFGRSSGQFVGNLRQPASTRRVLGKQPDRHGPYQRRSSVEGAMPLSQTSTFACSFDSPRGHIRSTSTRRPSVSAGSSYTRLTRMVMRFPFIEPPYHEEALPAPPSPRD
jgi:hypothetical protein